MPFRQRILRKFFRAVKIHAIMIALSLSITAIILVTGDETTLKENGEEIDSLRKQMDADRGDGSEILNELLRKIEKMRGSLTQLITDMEVSMQKKTDRLQTALDKRLIAVQDQVSDLYTNVNKLQTDMGSFQEKTNDRFLKVSKEIEEINRQIGQVTRIKPA